MHVHPRRVLEVDGCVLVRQLLQDARAAARTDNDPTAVRRRDGRAKDASRAHQGVRMRCEREDRHIDALEAGRRALEVAVVYCQHHGVTSVRAEDPRQPVLHPPVVARGALEEETLVRRGDVLKEVLVASCVGLGHVASCVVIG